ncbi:Aste57867_23252 [Aphanomyces stellatus]|uniref:Aste57867_23252 protein n=1 Tax=Aphanomyces stellatus TaxID=120398 RepID=A0A485LMB9_9STRA|nr:hypothetical protein As57867_023181 [Aphanomyces stellatus]VFT99897.1 Aste57867_23252 [Aphanomyces stellatus]
MKVPSCLLLIAALAALVHESSAAAHSNTEIASEASRELAAQNFVELDRRALSIDKPASEESRRALGNFVELDRRALASDNEQRRASEEEDDFYRRALTAFWAPVGDNDERRALTKDDERHLKAAPFSFRRLREEGHRAAAP